ncbi:MAG: DUF3667 domain-containing protein [Ferruginibacter sp.]
MTLKGIVQEIFHYFTHLDHGFPFTLKKLLFSPGVMQKEYVAGLRNKYQKPFSMFFICASVAALLLYIINLTLVNNFGTGDREEALFFQKYWVALQVAMFPIFASITYLFFYNTRYNFAEIIILQLYTFAMIFILLTVIHLLKFINSDLQTRYIELPVVIYYTIITNLHFFDRSSKYLTIIKTIFVIAISFFIASSIQDFLVDRYM